MLKSIFSCTNIFTLIILCIPISIQAENEIDILVKDKLSLISDDGIAGVNGVVKHGYYSGEAGEVGKFALFDCYEVEKTGYYNPAGYMNFESLMIFDDVVKLFQSSKSIGLNFNVIKIPFSAGETTSYTKNFEETNFSFSLSYVQYVTNIAQTESKSFGVGALTDKGKKIYDSVSYQEFEELCGDQFIHKYQQGALLLASLDISFDDKKSKEDFKKSLGISIGSKTSKAAIDIAKELRGFAAKRNIEARLSVKALQQGGDPAALGKILTPNADGKYYQVDCRFDELDECIDTMNSVIKYAIEEFSEQISSATYDTRGLIPLGMDYIESVPISMIGIRPNKLQVLQNEDIK